MPKPSFGHEIEALLDRLEKAGFEGWIVGGAVRDHLLGREIGDIDLATDATPDALLGLFPGSIAVGRQFLSMRVPVEGRMFEVTTYRTEGAYGDHRHPDVVEAAASIEEDLCRRDFTIGAICYHPKRGFYDPMGGLADLEAGVVRAVGDPDRRFEEDALRILRGIRLAAELNFTIELDTRAAMARRAFLLPTLAGERLLRELSRILLSDHPETLDPLIEADGLRFLGIGCDRGLGPLATLPSDPIPRWSAFLLATGGRIDGIGDRLSMSRRLRDGVRETIDAAKMLSAGHTSPAIKRVMSKVGPHRTGDAVEVGRVCGLFTEQDAMEIAGRMQGILQRGEPYRREMLTISGRDLVARGYTGKAVGKALDALLNYVIEHPEANQYTRILSDLMQGDTMGLQNEE